MRLVSINLSCDWANCDTVAPENEGLVTEMTLAVDGKQAKTFSICKPHRDELEENLHTLLARGITAEPAKKKAATRAAAASGNGSGTSAVATVPAGVTISCRVPVGVARCGQRCQGNVGLAQHLKKKHGMTIAEHDALPTG
jgi:hypothetical protein